MHKLAKIDILYHALKKFLILATAHRLTLKQKVVKTDRGRTERIRLDDVRAGLEVLRMNFFDNLWLS